MNTTLTEARRAVVMDHAEVWNHSEPLHPIWWQGRQWAVTEYGIEARDGTYAIAAHRLAQDIPDWSWLLQMAEKGWADVHDFASAFLVALHLHGVRIEPEHLKEAIRQMFKLDQMNR